MSHAARKTSRRDADLSARFTEQERNRVALAMAKTGQNLTDFIRQAVLRSTEQVLAQDPIAAFSEAIGAIHLEGDFARHADALYGEMLLEKHGMQERRSQP